MGSRSYRSREYEYEIILKRDGESFANKKLVVINRYVSDEAAQEVLYVFEEIILSEVGIPWVKQDESLPKRLRDLAQHIENDPPPAMKG